MSNKYVDISSIVQVIGCIFKNPNLLKADDKYFFNEEDFPGEFHKIIFGSIYNLHQLGSKEITIASIEDYLAQRPKKLAVYKTNKGAEYLTDCVDSAKLATFDYYYGRLKKMTLLRGYHELAGMDLSWLYDVDNIFDTKKKQQQEDWLDNTALEEISNLIDEKVLEVRMQYTDNMTVGGTHAGDGVEELLKQLIETPEIGYPLFGPLINTVVKGARLKKFYLRSAATGVGKSRSMVADACYIGCSQMYDLKTNKWISTGKAEPTLYIATEQPLDEIQTMMIAFLSGVNEDHILDGEYYAGEWDRVAKAAQLLKQSKIYFEALPDFSLKDVENTIKRCVREHGVKYIFHDYLHTSMKILEEITKRSGGVKLREDNILFMISIRLKDICNQYGVFIMTATQLNADYQESETPDQNLLRGAKSIADKIDVGIIMLEVTKKDLESLSSLIEAGYDVPDIKISIYKNRRGKYKSVFLWAKADRGICRIEPIFATKWSYELIDDMEDLKIKIEDESSF